MPTPILILLIILLTVIIGGLLLLIYWAKRLGILRSTVIYSDTDKKPGEVLISLKIKLHGKPDYLIEKNGVVYPIEFKKTKAPSKPYQNHIMQLIAYCFLVEENYGVRPAVGFIKYQDREFRVEYTKELEAYLINLISEILECKRNGRELHCAHSTHYSR